MMSFKKILLILLTVLSGLLIAGCEIMPVTRYKPTLHNPLPQMRTVAVLPFYNESGNGNLSGREFARCFANELQRIPGFHVISNEIVENTMLTHDLGKLENVDDIRYLAQLLKVDAVVVGKIHDFRGYYAPHVKFETEWYSVNPYLHPVPVGRGLPWGTEDEGFIPDKVLLLAEMELAAAQMKTQTPDFEPVASPEERRKKENPSEENDSDRYEFRWQPKEAKKENPIRLAGATIPNNMDRETLDEMELSDYAEYQQNQALNKFLATTGTPYIPEAQPMSEEDRKKAVLAYDPEMPHPLYYGPWPSETAKPDQNPWSDQSQYPLYRQQQMNPGFVNPGHYPAENYGMAPPADLTPEQLAQQMALYGWVNQQVLPTPPMYPYMPGMPVEGQPGTVMGEPDRFSGLPADWPDPRGFIPEGPTAEKPTEKIRNEAPIISHISFYEGNDKDFMQALQDYDFLFRDDKRLSGNQSILLNRNEFIRFCCRMHIWEIFSTRGGAGPAEKVVRQWKIWEGGERPY